MTSKRNLVDLAGSERLKKTMEGADGTAYDVDATMKKESMYINQSLTYLEQCVVGLSKRAPQHVAYRQTKLTGVLKDSLGGNCATLLFACMWAESAHLEETVSTLRLAQRMMRVQNTAEKVQTTDPARLARKQERLIRDLRQELLMHDALADRSGVKYDPYTPEEQAIIAAQCRRYADADEARAADLLEFDSVRQMREMCAQFKKLLRDAEAKAVRARTADTPAGGVPTGLFAGDEVGMGEDGGDAEAAGVGDAEAGRGLSPGRAPDASRPLVVVDARSPERASLAERSVGPGAKRRGKINRTFAAPSHRGAACGRRVARSCAAGARSFLQSRAAFRPGPRRSRGRARFHAGAESPSVDAFSAELAGSPLSKMDDGDTSTTAAARSSTRGARDARRTRLQRAKRARSDVKSQPRRAARRTRRSATSRTSTRGSRRRASAAARRSGRRGGDDDDVVDGGARLGARAATQARRPGRDAPLAARRDHAAAALDVDATKAQLVDDFQQFFAQLQRRVGLRRRARRCSTIGRLDKLEMGALPPRTPMARVLRAQKTGARPPLVRSHLRQLHRNKRTRASSSPNSRLYPDRDWSAEPGPFAARQGAPSLPVFSPQAKTF